MQIVIFDGCSGSGKTTLRYKLFYAMDFDVLTIDRFTPSVWVYDYLRGIYRTRAIQDFEERFNKFDPLFVLCLCNAEDARSRIKDNSLRKVEFDVEDELEAFEQYFLWVSRYSKKIKLDTSNLSIDECIVKMHEAL